MSKLNAKSAGVSILQWIGLMLLVSILVVASGNYPVAGNNPIERLVNAWKGVEVK